MTEQLKVRLREIAKECGGNRALCEKSGVSERTFANWLAGMSEPKVVGMASVAQAAGVTLDWLVTGSMPKMRLGARPAGNSGTIQIAKVNHKLKSEGNTLQSRFDVVAHIPFCQNFLKDNLDQSDLDKLFVVEVAGNSMEPTMSAGDFALVQQQEYLSSDGLYAYALDHAINVKRLMQVGSEVEVVSDHQKLYPSYRLANKELNKMQLLGRVIWIGKTPA